MNGTRDLGSPFSIFSPIKRQDAEGESRVNSPRTLNALNWLSLFNEDIRILPLHSTFSCVPRHLIGSRPHAEKHLILMFIVILGMEQVSYVGRIVPFSWRSYARSTQPLPPSSTL